MNRNNCNLALLLPSQNDDAALSGEMNTFIIISIDSDD